MGPIRAPSPHRTRQAPFGIKSQNHKAISGTIHSTQTSE